MKKIPLSVLEDFGFVRVFLDDLQEVARLLAHASRPDGGPIIVTIRAAGYELTASELAELEGQKTDRVEMMTREGVLITFAKNQATAFIPRGCAEDVETRGAVTLVRKYLDQNCRPPSRMGRLGLVMLGSILLSMAVAAILAHYHLDSGWRSWIPDTANAAACGSVLTFMRRREELILLVPRSKHQTWWATYKENHSHALVTNLIVGIVMLVLGVLVGHLWPQRP